VQDQRRLILDAEHWKGRGGCRNEFRIFAQVAPGKGMRFPDLTSIHVGKSVPQVVVNQGRVVLRGKIAQPQPVCVTQVMQARGLPQIPKTEQVVAHIEQIPRTKIREIRAIGLEA
jgi:hypothetical protein